MIDNLDLHLFFLFIQLKNVTFHTLDIAIENTPYTLQRILNTHTHTHTHLIDSIYFMQSLLIPHVIII